MRAFEQRVYAGAQLKYIWDAPPVTENSHNTPQYLNAETMGHNQAQTTDINWFNLFIYIFTACLDKQITNAK